MQQPISTYKPRITRLMRYDRLRIQRDNARNMMPGHRRYRIVTEAGDFVGESITPKVAQITLTAFRSRGVAVHVVRA